MIHPPPTDAYDLDDPDDDDEDETDALDAAEPSDGWRIQWGRFGTVLVVAAGLVALGVWVRHRPLPSVMPAPTVTPELETQLLTAISPGWPSTPPSLDLPTGAVPAVAGRISSLAAADVDGDGRPEWGVAYAWLGPESTDGARAIQPGFAILTGGRTPELLFKAKPAGGWDSLDNAAFLEAAEVDQQVEAVKLAPRELGFLSHYTVESTRGGRLTNGRSRLFTRGLGTWGEAWEAVTDFRWRAGHADEVSHSAVVKVEDRDGDGVAELALAPSHYFRRLDKHEHGVHFMADGPGDLIYHRKGAGYYLSGLAVPGEKKERRIRPAQPLYATRAPGAIAIDGEFGDWDTGELFEMSGLRFDDLSALKFKRREREGLEDFSGEVNLMWDTERLYLRAMVQDNVVVPGPPGKDLYQGDNLSLWLDMDLDKDFDQAARNGDDWQLGLSPGPLGAPAEAWSWVPQAGRLNMEAASKPMRDPYNGALRGYQLEAAIPWSSLGGLPVGMKPGSAVPMAPPRTTEPRRYHLHLAGIAGIGIVASDADTDYQELVYVSNPGFAWSEPKTFNTLLLVEADAAR